jgi:high-affinity iron transporter
MLPTFVIGLREGLEAALIVGIIAAFLKKQGRSDLMGWLFTGVAAAVLLCVAVGVALDIVSRDLPQRQQEGLETVVGVLAVGMVTYMVVWMRRHSRELKGHLEELAGDAISASGGTAARALVVMAFLAVLREGFETVVFLLAAFNEAQSPASAGLGALLGILIAVALGYGIYKGGVHINLSRFFRVTGLVLVLVAAGLVVSALHTAHEAGWFAFGQSATLDLTRLPIIGWLVRAGSVQASLLTGMLGIQPRPVLIEVVGWLLYLIPVGIYVAWPPGRPVARGRVGIALAAVGGVAVAVSLALAFTLPASPQPAAVTGSGSASAQLLSSSGNEAVVRTQIRNPASPSNAVAPSTTDIRVRAAGLDRHDGLVTNVYSATLSGTAARDLPSTLSVDQLSALGHGRLPIGVRTVGVDTLPVQYRDADVLTVWTIPSTGRIVDMQWTETVNVSVLSSVGSVPVDQPIARVDWKLPASTRAAAESLARGDDAAQHERTTRLTQISLLLAIVVLAGAGVAILVLTRRRRPANSRRPDRTRIPTPA